MPGKKFYITTPIYYVNDQPHIGHAYTTIAADVVARYKRQRGHDVFFLTGVDEHGQKVQEAAKKRNVPPKQHCDELCVRFKDLWRALHISNDYFIRTTDEAHKDAVRSALQKLHDKGEIYKGSYEGWYCLPDERFWMEKDLVDGNCPECGRKVEHIKEYNYFFKMGSRKDWLVEHIRSHPDFIQPESRRNEVLGFLLSKDLGDLCISRPKERLAWGIPLPFDEGYVTYVWFDALLNYASGVGYPSDEKQFRTRWPASFHLVGKDILTTHSVYWSTMLEALGLPLPESIFAHGWWTINGRKMSKSLQNVVEPNQLVDEFGAEPIRYFLLREVPFGLDGDFSRHALIGRINSDLANNLGNLFSRALQMIMKFSGGEVPAPGAAGEGDAELKSIAGGIVEGLNAQYQVLAFSKILASIWHLVDFSNKYIVVNEPWSLAKSDEKRARLNTVLYNVAESLRITAVLIYPFMPQTAGRMLDQLGLKTDASGVDPGSLKEWGGLPSGLKVNLGDALFPRIDEKRAKKILAGAEPAALPDQATEEKDRITIEDFMKVDLRAGVIREAERIEKSKKLLKLKVDIGSETRQVCAGIAESYAPEDLLGKKIILVANLQPAKLMGIESQGMVLAASAGDRIILAGFNGGEVGPGWKVK
ncbi:MAG: methionine--tRNA ligase [Nitrospinae bacterium]|nr:methionine--tRNA ligase [Nitrospinota bacterium]